MNLCSVKQPVYVLGFRTVAAQQSVIAEHPQIARLCDCFVRWLGNLIRIGQSFRNARPQQLGKLVLIETDEIETEFHPLQVSQFDRQQIEIPFR